MRPDYRLDPAFVREAAPAPRWLAMSALLHDVDLGSPS
jgi:hypothetical protein